MSASAILYNDFLTFQQAIIWTNADPIDWHIYAAPGRDELKGQQPFIFFVIDGFVPSWQYHMMP